MHWYFVENGAAVGPLDLAQMQAMHAGGRLVESTQVCRMGASAWMDACRDEVLAALFTRATAPTAPSAPWISSSVVTSVTLPEFSFKAAWSIAIETFKKHWAMLLLLSVVYMAVATVMGIPGQIGNFAAQLSDDRDAAAMLAGVFGCCGAIIQVFVGIPLGAGMYIAGANAVAGKPDIKDLFVGFRRYWATLGAGFVSACLIFVAVIAAILPGGACLALGFGLGGGLEWVFVPIGVILLATGYICVIAFVGVRLFAAGSLACDPTLPPMSVGAALKTSWEGSRGKVWPLVGYGLTVGLAVAGSILLLCVGLLLVGIPFAFAALGAAYAMLYRRGNTALPAQPSA